MYFKFRTIAGIEVSSIKKIINDLTSLRKEYIDAIEPVKSDINNYHIVAFHKFTFLYHQFLSKLLQVESMNTTTELIEKLQKLNSLNYKLNKDVKALEDQLMKEADKKKFFELKSKLEDLIYRKNFFATLEINVVKNGLNEKLSIFNDRIDEIEFSGQKITKDDVLEMFIKWDRYLNMLTDVSHLDDKADEGAPNFILDELKNLLKSRKKVGAEKEDDFFDVESDPLNKDSISKIVENKKKWKSSDPYREVDNIIGDVDKIKETAGSPPEKGLSTDAKDPGNIGLIPHAQVINSEHYDDDTLKKIDKIIDKYKKYLGEEKGEV